MILYGIAALIFLCLDLRLGLAQDTRSSSESLKDTQPSPTQSSQDSQASQQTSQPPKESSDSSQSTKGPEATQSQPPQNQEPSSSNRQRSMCGANNQSLRQLKQMFGKKISSSAPRALQWISLPARFQVCTRSSTKAEEKRTNTFCEVSTQIMGPTSQFTWTGFQSICQIMPTAKDMPTC